MYLFHLPHRLLLRHRRGHGRRLFPAHRAADARAARARAARDGAAALCAGGALPSCRGARLVLRLSAALRLDVSERLVSVSHLLRLRRRHGDLSDAHGPLGRVRRLPPYEALRRAARAARFRRARRAVHPVRLLLHRLALPLARLAHGALSHELAREHRFHRVECRHGAGAPHHRLLRRLPRLRRARECRPAAAAAAAGTRRRAAWDVAAARDPRRSRAALLCAADLVWRARQRRAHLCGRDADLRRRPRGPLRGARHRRHADAAGARARHGHRRHRRVSLAQLHARVHAGLPVRGHALARQPAAESRVQRLHERLLLLVADRARAAARAHGAEPVQRQRILQLDLHPRRREKGGLCDLLVQQPGALRPV